MFAVLFGAIFTIVFESIVLALTWSRTADISLRLRKQKIDMPITHLLWRDGARRPLSMASPQLTAFLYTQGRSTFCESDSIFVRQAH